MVCVYEKQEKAMSSLESCNVGPAAVLEDRSQNSLILSQCQKSLKGLEKSKSNSSALSWG